MISTKQVADYDKYARARIRAHLPKSWQFAWNKSIHDIGLCNFDTKTIYVSIYYAMVLPKEEVYDTVNHEIAHAIAGPRETHSDPTWQYWARRLGAKVDYYLDEDTKRDACTKLAKIVTPACVVYKRGMPQKVVKHYFRTPTQRVQTKLRSSGFSVLKTSTYEQRYGKIKQLVI